LEALEVEDEEDVAGDLGDGAKTQICAGGASSGVRP
jgi:hypothetical protein